MSVYKKELQSIMKEYGLEKDKEAKNIKKIRSSQIDEIHTNVKNAEAELYEITNRKNNPYTNYKSLYNNSKSILKNSVSKEENLVKRFEKDLQRIIQERSKISRNKTLNRYRNKKHSKLHNITRRMV